jgi:DNA topoisomerase-1
MRHRTRLPSGPIGSRQAHSAGLIYVNDRRPGIQRLGAAPRFRYLDRGHRLRAPGELERIERLAIPPAWQDVWICPNPRGHLQATGRDARGRKQYRYHAEWRRVRDNAKYEQLLAFAAALPVRRRIARDLASPTLSKKQSLLPSCSFSSEP